VTKHGNLNGMLEQLKTDFAEELLSMRALNYHQLFAHSKILPDRWKDDNERPSKRVARSSDLSVLSQEVEKLTKHSSGEMPNPCTQSNSLDHNVPVTLPLMRELSHF
jgi:hypothetical protein